ncbi:MAG: argininosuccinate synthase [Clostridia bacterium]|nr:argininosuccinate synthase [Clostridia bacterium]MDH7573840.1 argininosuccinate synthase [Clostridia bacterium]
MAKVADRRRSLLGSFILALVLGFLATSAARAAEPTTSVRLVKYAADHKTVVAEKQVDYRWMEANLPVHGDGKTHYYHQGPVFEGDKWDPTRTKNLKDKGAVKGTDLKDLCDLVGGMAPGDEVVVSAPDGYYVKFGHRNVYAPPDRQGPIVLCWYNGEEVQAGERQGRGYVPDYFAGMRLVFMPKVPNAEGKYVFGNQDMKECFDENYWHYYENLYPSTNGLTAKWVNQIAVYSGGAPEQPAVLAAEANGGAGASPSRSPSFIIWLLAAAGAAVIGLAVYFLKRK